MLGVLFRDKEISLKWLKVTKFQYFLLWHQSHSLSKSTWLVNASAKTLNNDDEFDHFEYDFACTLEDFEEVSNVCELEFGTINEVIDVGRLRLH